MGLFSLKFLDHIPLGEFLVEQGRINRDQLNKALLIQKNDGGLIGIILENLGFVDSEIIQKFTKIRLTQKSNSIIFSFLLLQIPFILSLSFYYKTWFTGLVAAGIILIISLLFQYIAPEKLITMYVYSFLLVFVTIIIVNCTNKEIQAHIFPVIIPGILLLYRNSSLFIFTGIVLIIYYMTGWIIQDYYFIAYKTIVPFTRPVIQCIVIMFQCGLLWVLAKFMEKEWKKKINLSHDIQKWKDKHKEEKLKFGINDISQIMYLHTIAEGVKHASAIISTGTDDMSLRSKNQVKQVIEIGEAIKEVTEFFEHMEKETVSTSEITADTVNIANGGQEEVLHTIDVMNRIVNISEETTDMMHRLGDSSEKIGDVANVIEGIASQTNLLALNAAIEAARAGEEGRGFAVVADEVGKLADLTQGATNDINNTIKKIQEEIKFAIDKVSKETEETRKGIDVAHKAGRALEKIVEQINRLDLQVKEIADLSKKQSGYADIINNDVQTISSFVSESDIFISGISDQISELRLEAENLGIIVKIFNLDISIEQQNALILELANNFVKECTSIIESKINENVISVDDLFDRDYRLIPDTDPPKYHTKFDSFVDKYIQDLEEKYLNMDSNIAFLVIVDNNGYLPTHNLKYNQKLTGNKKKDLINNRTKRIFNDRTGLNAAKNKSSYLLQTYQRDTNEFMNDLSLPLYFQGKHWGAVRIGFYYSKEILFDNTAE